VTAAGPPPTSHDVARAAGVSQPTVSRALRDDPRVAAETRERVKAAAASLGYVTSRRGRSLSTRSTGQVAVVVGALGNAFYVEAVERLHAELEAAGRRLVVLTDRPVLDASPAAPDGEAIERLLDGGVDGAILATSLLGSSLPVELAARGLPTVLFNRTLDGDAVDACESENEDGARQVARELLALGHRRIGAIFGPLQTSTGRDREVAFRAALAEAGAPLAPERVRHGSFTHETGHRAFAELLALPQPPTAVFCANDVIALGALNAARGLGVAVPAQVTVVGFDDIAMAGWEVYRLTTVRQDLAAMARATVTLLEERIADPARPARRVTLPARLVLRDSHAPPA
jgi:LacI family transcriptional regulator